LMSWINKTLQLPVGESFHIACNNKSQRKEFMKALKKEMKIMADVTPSTALQIKLYPRTKDSEMYVVLEKVDATPLVGFKKRIDGVVERITIPDPAKERRLKLMREDGLTLEEIEEIEGELNEEEREII